MSVLILFLEIRTAKDKKVVARAYCLSYFETAQPTLCSLHPILKIVPLSTSSVSKILRVRSVQYIIMETLSGQLWRPFYFQNRSIAPELLALLVPISERLAVPDRSRECLWRYLTYERLDATSEGSNSPQSPEQNPC
jgi:hypothetical protein